MRSPKSPTLCFYVKIPSPRALTWRPVLALNIHLGPVEGGGSVPLALSWLCEGRFCVQFPNKSVYVY